MRANGKPIHHLNEFSLIKTYFEKNTPQRDDVALGIGDDAALLRCMPDQLLVATTDTLVEGVHFPKETAAQDLAYKALAINLSDLAAMGAEPLWFTLALTLPQADPEWLQAFSQGLFQLAQQFHMQLVGGDTTRGPLSLTIQALGRVPEKQALRRQGAQAGDIIYVSGTLGDAGLGLALVQGKIAVPEAAQPFILERFYRPSPRLALGQALAGIANAAIDLSDGLVADLGHILECSQVGAQIWADKLPLSTAMRETLSLKEAQALALSAGEDYELCFTVPQEKEGILLEKLKSAGLTCTAIGILQAHKGIEIKGFFGTLQQTGYQHFR